MKWKNAVLISATLVLGAGCDPGSLSQQKNGTIGASVRQESSTQEASSKGPTVAPDLLLASRFRPGPETDDGNPTTLVEFEFDQKTYLTGGDRTNFKLVPKDGDGIFSGTGKIPVGDKRSDKIMSVVFPGELAARDIVRGYVDAGKVSSSKSGDGSTNVLQAASVSASGGTPAPDLLSVTRKGEKLLLEFDANIDPEQVNDTGGFRAYDANAKTYKGNSARRSGSDTRTIAVTFDDFDIANAVGASVNQGAVEVTREDGELPNAPDEALVSRAEDGSN